MLRLGASGPVGFPPIKGVICKMESGVTRDPCRSGIVCLVSSLLAGQILFLSHVLMEKKKTRVQNFGFLDARFLFTIFRRCKESLDSVDQTKPPEQGDLGMLAVLCSSHAWTVFLLLSSPHVTVELLLQQEPPQLLKATVVPGFIHFLSPVFYQAGLLCRVWSPSPNQQGFPVPSLFPDRCPGHPAGLSRSNRHLQPFVCVSSPLLESGPASSSAAVFLWFLSSCFSVGNSSGNRWLTDCCCLCSLFQM